MSLAFHMDGMKSYTREDCDNGIYVSASSLGGQKCTSYTLSLTLTHSTSGPHDSHHDSVRSTSAACSLTISWKEIQFSCLHWPVRGCPTAFSGTLTVTVSYQILPFTVKLLCSLCWVSWNGPVLWSLMQLPLMKLFPASSLFPSPHTGLLLHDPAWLSKTTHYNPAHTWLPVGLSNGCLWLHLSLQTSDNPCCLLITVLTGDAAEMRLRNEWSALPTETEFSNDSYVAALWIKYLNTGSYSNFM